MDGKIDLFTLISLIVAVVAILKLRSVLGQTSHDDDARVERLRRERQEREAASSAAASASNEKVVTLRRRDRPEPVAEPQAADVSLAGAEARIKSYAGVSETVTDGLLGIVRIDETFDPELFIRGARQAYEMIVTAFAEGNRKILKDLLSREVFDGFSAAIADRETRGEQVDQSFVGISKADILEADTKHDAANITVRFLSQLISATRDRAGGIVAGDPQKIKEVTDIWTFSRDLSSAKARANPNWKLVATQASN